MWVVVHRPMMTFQPLISAFLARPTELNHTRRLLPLPKKLTRASSEVFPLTRRLDRTNDLLALLHSLSKPISQIVCLYLVDVRVPIVAQTDLKIRV